MDPQDAGPGVGPGADEHLRYRRTWRWSGGGDFPWLGTFLIALGAALVVREAAPILSSGRLFGAFFGLAFWAAFFFGAMGWAGVAAAIIGGWGLSGILQELGYVSGSGWTPLLIGAGFLVVYLAELAMRGGRLAWTLWIGLALVVLGALEVGLRQVPGLPPLDALVIPLILIAIGVLLVIRAARRP